MYFIIKGSTTQNKRSVTEASAFLSIKNRTRVDNVTN